MAAIIDSSPECVTNTEGYDFNGDGDDLDFILQANYESCEGFMTFGPGSTYGDEGVGAEGAYMALTWIGIAVFLIAMLLWVVLENRRLTGKE